MSDPPKSVPTLSFGTPATSGGSTFGGSSQVSTSDNKTNSLFGSVNNNNPSGSTLFGGTGNNSGGTQQSSLFGAGVKSGQGSSLFGAASSNTNPTSTAFNFGPQPTTSNNQSSGFNFGKPPETGSQKTTSASGPFSAFSTPDKTSAPTSSGQTQTSSIFGGLGNTGGNGLFGGAASSTPATNKQSGEFSFGNPSTTPAGPPPSGSNVGGATGSFMFNKPQQQTAPALGNLKVGTSSGQEPSLTAAPTGLFGNLAQSNSGGGGLFGSSKPVNNNSSTTSATPSSGMFAAKNTNSGTGLFNMISASKPAGGLFGNVGDSQSNSSSTAAPAAPTPATTGAPQQTQQAQTDAPAQGSNMFAGLGSKNTVPAATTQATAPSTFSALGSGTSLSTTTSKPAFSFPSSTPTTTTQPLVPATTATASTGPSNPFGNLGTSTAGTNNATPAITTSTAGLFADLGNQADKSANANSQASSTAATGGLTASSAPAPSSSLFGVLNQPATSTATSQLSGTAAPDSSKTNSNTIPAPSLGTSTSGPAPPAQSRLKNKSMDEIITRWASDLSKYQKEFQSQAEKVAKWDRMLLENSDKIQKLYGSTLEAERAKSEVERQLSSVESQQEELSGWLDRYEREVEEMTARQVGQGEGLSGPDQERERT